MNNASFDTLLREFRTPSGEYAPLLMWFWNDVITEEQITFQMEKMREQNITNFFIHPACGFTVEYLSDRYMELIRYVVQEAKRLGMRYWIYDEYEFPSGTAGGILCRDYPQYRKKHLRVADHFLHTPGVRVNLTSCGEFVGAQLITQKRGRTLVQDISGDCEIRTDGGVTTLNYCYKECSIPGRALFYFSEVDLGVRPSGTNRLGAEGIQGYVDMLNPAAVGKFIELTHERYKAAIGDEFGRTVPGVFTDEPTPMGTFDYVGIGPWNDDFAAEFEKDHGYSIYPLLYALWDMEAKSPEEIRVQQDYRDTIKRLYFTSFMKQIHGWCRENNLIYTGHFGGEENLMHQIAQGDMLEELMLFDMPGADSILSVDRIETPEFNIAGKLAASAAKFADVDRILCETYTGSGWRLRFPMMKRIANRLLVMGINWIQYMGAFYTVGAGSKNFPFGFAPSHNYQNTLFAHYHELNRYIAGFQALSAATRPDSSTLVFIPLNRALHDRPRQIRGKWNEDDSFADIVNGSFIDTVNALLYEGIGFDFFSENLTDAITVHDGFVEAYGYRYETLIFPRMRYVNGKTRALIERLKAHNVRMIFTYELPDVDTDTGETFDLGFAMQPYCSPAGLLRQGSTYLIRREFPAALDTYRSAFRAAIPDRILRIEADAGVYICKRSNADCEVYFLCNDGSRDACAVIDALPGMRILNPETGEETAYAVEDDRVYLTLDGCEMIAILRDKQGTTCPVTTRQPEQTDWVMTVEGPYAFRAEGGNCLPLDYEMYDGELQEWVPCQFMHFAPEIHLRPSEYYHLRARVQIDRMPEKLWLNAEVMRTTRLAVNGTELPFCVNTKRWSPWDYTVEVTELLHAGENWIELDGYAESFAKFGRPQYLFLSGDFTVEDGRIAAPVEAIDTIGWDKAGYPRYCGDGIYTIRVCVDQVFRRAALRIPTQDIAVVYVNGEFAGKKLWLRDMLDVTGLLRQGENTIEVRITSTRANMFGCRADGFDESIFYGSYAPMRTENGILAPVELHFAK